MGNSRIDCKHIHRPNCTFYIEGRYCPEKCEGFESNNESIIDHIVENKESFIKGKK